MLVLTRKLNQSIIIINDNVTVTIVGIKGNQVRIAIKAPREVPDNREEIRARQQEFADADEAMAVCK